MNTRGDRDEQYRQKVVEYEKSKIEPALTEYYSKNTANENEPFRIFSGKGTAGLYNFNDMGMAYRIAPSEISMMGGNILFILGVIKDLYEKEGYKVVLDDSPSGREMITVSQ